MSESAERKRKAAEADLYVDLTKDESEESEERIILASNVRDGKLEYLVKWVGMPDCESSWVPAEDLAHDHELLAAFHSTTSSRHGSPMVSSKPVENPSSASSHRAFSPQVAVSTDPPSAKRVKVNSSPDNDRVVQLLSSPPQSPSRVAEESEEPHSDVSAAKLVEAPESPAILQYHLGSPVAAPIARAPNTSMNICRGNIQQPRSSWASSLRGLEDVEICAESCPEAVIRVSRESLESMDSTENRSGRFAELKFDIEAIRESAPHAHRKFKDVTLKVSQSFFGILSEQSSVLDEPKVPAFPTGFEVLIGTIDIPIVVRDFSDSKIDQLNWSDLPRKLKYGQMRLPSLYEGIDAVREFYAASGACMMSAKVLASRSFVAPSDENLDLEMRRNSGIWSTLYPESTSLQKWNSVKDFSMHESFSSLQPAVADLACKIWSSSKAGLEKSNKVKNVDFIRPAHARPSIAAKIANSMFQLESKSSVYDRQLLNAHLMRKGCSIRIEIPDHEIEFDECFKSNLTRRELICHRNGIDNETLDACAAITGLVVDIKNMVVVEFRTAADEPITLWLDFDEHQITHQKNSPAISNLRPKNLGDWVKIIDPKEIDHDYDEEVDDDDEPEDEVEDQDAGQDEEQDEEQDEDQDSDQDEIVNDPELVWYGCTGRLIKQWDNGNIQVKLPKNKLVSCELSNLRKIDRQPPLPLKVHSVVRIQLPEDQDAPTCGWGRVSESSVGTVLSISHGIARVQFPECSNLKVLATELEVLSNTERFELGTLVKLRVSGNREPPESGWNLVSEHCIGRIIRIRSATAASAAMYTVRFPFDRKWCGYAESLESVYNPELSFIADAPAMLATLNTPLARRDSLQLPHELFGPQIDVNFWKTPLHHDPFVYSGHVFNLRVDSIDPIQELEAEIQSSIDCLSICGLNESFADQTSAHRRIYQSSKHLFREIALNLSLSKSLNSLFITEYNYNSKHDWFVSSFLPLKLRLADFLSSPDIFSIRTSAPPAPEHPNASSNSDPLAHSIRFSYEPDDTARSRNYQLNVALKPYQQQTVEWMIAEENDPVGFHRHFYDLIQVVGKEHRTRHSIWISALLQDVCSKHDLPLCHGGVVCEEMGLGKTIEVIALIAANRVPRLPRNKLITHNGYIRHRSSATLVLVPPTLVGQWCDEFSKRHIGDLRLLKYYGPTRPHCPADLLQYDIVLTTFSVLVQEMKRPNSCFDLIYWHRVVVDEAHILKNTTTVQSRYIKKLRAKNKWCLTGTPISSSHAEIQGYLEFLGLAAAQSSQRWADKMTQPCRLSILNGLFMRHTKSQLFNGVPLLSLPKITERRIWIQFPDEQRSAYNRLAAKANELFQRFDHVGRACPRLLEVLALLLPVRRACSGERFDLAQMQLNLEIADQQLMVMGYSQADINAGQHHLLAAPIAYNAEDIECVICLEELEDPLQTPCRHVFCRACIASIAERLKACPICRQPIDVASLSAPPARQAAVPSVAPVAAEIVHFTAKVDALMHELQQLRRTHPQEKALVFSQFSATLAMVSNRMSARGMPWRSLSGSMSADQRQRQVELFNNDPPGSVFLLPLRSSAVGLTLTSATHVFMLDPCLNPALEQQAKNRVYRMGQTKDVYFYRLLMKHSVESNMDLLMRNRESEFSSASTDALKKAAYTVDELRILFSTDAAASERYETGAGANKPLSDVQPPASVASIASAALPASPAQAESHPQSEMSGEDSSQDQDSEVDEAEGDREQNEEQYDDQGEAQVDEDQAGDDEGEVDQDSDEADQSQSESDDESVVSDQPNVVSAPDDVDGQYDDQGGDDDEPGDADDELDGRSFEIFQH